MEKQEIWKDIPGYEGLYQVSNMGNVKSLKFNKERILKPGINSPGYYYVKLYRNKKLKNIQVHQIITIVFLGHQPDGYNIVVDHINGDRLDNRLENLQLISHRKNIVKSLNDVYTSRFTGVCWHKHTKKWRVKIHINKKDIGLGRFDNEEEASEVYKKALEMKDQYNGCNKSFRELINI